MRTAEKMFNYCLEKDFGQGSFKKWGLKHFKLIENNLQPDEDVLITFIGIHNFESLTKHENNFAYALTNKRLIFAQKKLIGERVKTVFLDLLNDVTLETATGTGLLMNAVLTFDTMKERFNVMINAKQGKNILSEIQKILLSNKEEKKDPVEEILKYKKLLDAGVIDQEEFEQKKKELAI